MVQESDMSHHFAEAGCGPAAELISVPSIVSAYSIAVTVRAHRLDSRAYRSGVASKRSNHDRPGLARSADDGHVGERCLDTESCALFLAISGAS
jgi:hypothetical protein